MVERISSGGTARASAETRGVDKSADKGAGKGVTKGGLFSKRNAQREDVGQRRQAGKENNKQASNKQASNKQALKNSKISSRASSGANSKGNFAPARPRAPTNESREARRARLHETGAQLKQHKSESKQAMDSHHRDLAQRLEQNNARANSLSGGDKDVTNKDVTNKDTTNKDVAEVKWGTLDGHGMKNKLRQLDDVMGHKAAGREYKLLKPPALVERKAVLRASPQGFVGRLGSKIKDTLLRIFRPRQWQARQVELSLARKDEMRAAQLFAKSLANKPLDKQLAAMSEVAYRDEQRGVKPRTISDASVEEAAVKPHIGAPSAYVVAYDERIQQDPRYQAEKAILDKGIDGLRKEAEDEAKRHINEVLSRQQARGKVGEPAPAAQKVSGKEIRGDVAEGDNLSRSDSVKNPHATSL